VVVVDEFSMVNEDNFAKICEAAVSEGVKVIFVGDAAQLPPVGEHS
jgi:ATP-dependent exoDNAse (exonuclease V) alpha subunit